MMPAVLLFQLALKASVVLAAAAMIAAGLRRGSAASRHLVWALGLAATLALPLARLAAPTVVVTIPHGALPETAWSAVTATTAEPARPQTVQQSAVLLPQAPVSSAAPAAANPVSGRLGLPEWPVLIVGLWALGAVLFLAALAAGFLRAARIARSATPVDDDGWLEAFDDAAGALRVDRRVELRMTAETSVPVACGLWRPTVLLPIEALRWPRERRTVVLLHELAHVRRRDCLVQAMGQLTRALHWFNPLAHLALRRLRAEQERACDDLVLSTGTQAPTYADHLFAIAREFRTPAAPAWATLAMARPSQLEGRVMAILDDRCNRAPAGRRVRAALTVCAVTTIVLLGALHVTSESPVARALLTGEDQPLLDLAAIDSQPASEPAPQPQPEPDPRPGQAAPAAPAAPAAQGTAQPTEETRRRVADALATAINDENASVRAEALRALASLRDPRAVPAFVKALNDPDAELREDAVNGLANFDTPEALAGLVSALKDSSPDVREHAVRHVGAKVARGRIPAETYIDAMAGLVRDQEPDIREAAAQALGMSRSARGVPSLIALLKDPEKDVREAAAQALGAIADPSAIDALTAALKDADPEVRERAAMSLARIARGERRGPMVLPVPPGPPRPIGAFELDAGEFERIRRTAMDQALKTLNLTLDQLNRTSDVAVRTRFDTQVERQIEQQIEQQIEALELKRRTR